MTRRPYLPGWTLVALMAPIGAVVLLFIIFALLAVALLFGAEGALATRPRRPGLVKGQG